MNQKKYIFVKEFKTSEGSIPEGTEIIIFRGFIYMNGGMVHPAYQKLFINLICNDNLKDEYLREVRIINNKV